MPDFSRITLVSVTGLGDAQGAAWALELSLRQMPGARALLLSPQRPLQLGASVEHRAIAPLSYHEYSWFMMFALWRFVETDFALIVQDDGWVLDAANWQDEFFDYDYIGAPIHLGRVNTPGAIVWMKSFLWHDEIGKPGTVVMPVLNGGFCLRSRRMMRVLVDHPQIRVEIPPPDVIETDPIKMKWFHDALNEDVQLSGALRPQLEAVGVRFAPLDVCTRFAMEDAGPMYHDMDPMKLLGVHGWWRRLTSIDPLTVNYRVARHIVDESDGERALIRMLEQRGYQVQFPAPAQ